MLIAECFVFALTGNNFLSSANAFEVTRLSAEIGLLALALTPIIITGGIDLSVGSMMGLSAVVLGSLWRDAHLADAARDCHHIIDWIAWRRSECVDDRAIEFPSADRNVWGRFLSFAELPKGLLAASKTIQDFRPRFCFWGRVMWAV